MKFVQPLHTLGHSLTLPPFQRFLRSLCVEFQLYIVVKSSVHFSCHYLGDIADERFMKKANTSDITQFTLLFPSTSTSCMFTAGFLAFAHCLLFNPVVWIIFWLTLSAGSFVGFSFLGQIVWKVGFSSLPSLIHASYRGSSIPTKCTRKPVCFPYFLCFSTDTLYILPAGFLPT